MKIAIVKNDEVLAVLKLEAVPRKGEIIRDMDGKEFKVLQVVWQQNLFIGEDEVSAQKCAARVMVK